MPAESQDLPPELAAAAERVAHRMIPDPHPDEPMKWPAGVDVDDTVDATTLANLIRPLTAADAEALRRGEPLDLKLYGRTISLDQIRQADAVPLPIEVDVVELIRAGMHLFYAIYYLPGGQARTLINQMPEQVLNAYVRAGRAFAPEAPPQEDTTYDPDGADRG